MEFSQRVKDVSAEIEAAIKEAPNVLIMGHRFSDSDSIGAAVGMLKFCQDLEKEARIVISTKTSLATPLINHLKRNEIDKFFLGVDEALEVIGEDTLLIVVDTHRATFFESRELYEKANKVVVIDHHERSIDCIENAYILCHDANASSASEMVTMLISSNDNISLSPVYANALLAGIMLDTRDFMLRTSVNTFSCAAILRLAGADTAAVKQFFNNSLKNKKLKGKVVLSAYEYHNCAISLANVTSDNIRLVCAQAADDLLSVNDVEASFVLFMTEDTVNISARSKGNINVREIMEKFSGGGHQTMAACQVENANIEDVKVLLEKRIDEQLNISK